MSASRAFAYDGEFGYLTACPSNLGTGLRASVMLFLPALSRRGCMKHILPVLARLGLTVRGVYGEGSGAEGDLFQVSNEVTLGVKEEDLLAEVERAVSVIVETELRERARMKAEEGVLLKDKVCRSYGILSNCCRLEEREMNARIADLKLGVVIGYIDFEGGMSALDRLAIDLRPSGIDAAAGHPLPLEEQCIRRAALISERIGALHPKI